MKSEKKELLAGALTFVLAVALFAFVGLHKGAGNGSSDSYRISVRFNRTDGLNVGDDVRLAGVRVGSVVSQKLDDYFGVVTTFSLPSSVALPDDSGASIQSDGLLGAKFIELMPGGSEDMLGDGDTLSFSEDALNLESLLDKVISLSKAAREKRRSP